MKILRPAACFILLCFLSLQAAFASNSDLYTVKGITVDVTAGSAKAAQEKAMAEGRHKAFKALLERLLSPEDHLRMRDISPAQSDAFIRDYEVAGEKYSAVRYMASLTFRFDSVAVKRFLDGQRVEVAAMPKNPILVIPLLILPGETPKLWHDNPWLLAWANRSSVGGIIPIIIPLGDLADITDLDAQGALNLDHDRLNAIARRYGASATMVVRAQADKARLDIDASLVTLEGEVRKLAIDPLMTSETDTEKIYREAIARVTERLNASGKDKTDPVMSSQEQHLPVKVILSSSQDWANLQRQLFEISTISNVHLKTLSRKQALIDLTFHGSIPMLESALGARGFNLTAGEGNSWMISAKTYPLSKL